MSIEVTKNGLSGLEESAIKLENIAESALILEKGLPNKSCLNTFYTRDAFYEDLGLVAEGPIQKEFRLNISLSSEPGQFRVAYGQQGSHV